MLSIYDEASADEALNQPLDPALRSILTGRLADAAAIGLADLTHIVAIQPGDTEAMLTDELGWSPLVNPIDEIRYGETGFMPFWSWLEDLTDYYEIIVSSGNAGFAYLLLVQQAKGVLPDLLRMCREHCEQQCAL
jgi:hypothetical protein